MTSHVFHEIYLHLNWHVKNDRPTLLHEVETLVHQLIAHRCGQRKGVYFHGIGGTENHVHLVVNVEPHVTISELVQEIKGGSSHNANKTLGKRLLYWQRGYGVVSFGRKNLRWVLDYLANQKSHHARGVVYPRLERMVEEENGG